MSVRSVAARHRQVVRAVMVSQRQQAVEAEAANSRDGLGARGRRNNRYDRTAGYFIHGHAHRIGGANHPRVGVRHPPDGGNRPALARHREARARGDRFLPNKSAHRDVVHVDEVLPESLDVDPGPVGGRIGAENGDDLSDGGERGLASAGGTDLSCPGRMSHALLMGVVLTA